MDIQYFEWHPPQLKYWMPIHHDTIEDEQNKKSHLLFSSLVRIILFLHFIGVIDLSKILLHHFIGFIWIVAPLMKMNVSIQETKIIAWRSSHAWIPFAYGCVTQYAVFTRVKYATIMHNCWTRYPSFSRALMDGWSFGQNQWNFLLACYTMPSD